MTTKPTVVGVDGSEESLPAVPLADNKENR
jgi:hypothetical protein